MTFFLGIAQAQPKCYAKPHGEGTLAAKVTNAQGEGAYWRCPDGTVVVIARATGYRLVVPADLPASASTGDLLNAIWKANAVRDCSKNSQDTRIGEICRATWAAALADPSMQVLWRVAPNPQSTTVPPTRPMWNPEATAQVSERAYVDDLCDCAAPILKGTQTLCPLRKLGDIEPTKNRAACVQK